MTGHTPITLVRRRIASCSSQDRLAACGVQCKYQAARLPLAMLLALVMTLWASPQMARADENEPSFDRLIGLGAPKTTLSVAVGDLNGDGFLDIVQGNDGQSYVYLGDGQGDFDSGTPFGSEQWTFSVAMGDLNGDGFLDIVQGNFGQSFVYLNDGQGGFGRDKPTPLDKAQDTFGVAVGDLNDDGFLDIVQGNDGQSYVYLNNGQEGFANGTPFDDGTLLGDEQNTRSVAVGDINNDGFLDIIQGNSGQSFVYLNDGQEAFVSTARFGAGQDTQSIAVGDLDADGSLDIIQGISNGQSYIYLNDGQGNVATGIHFDDEQDIWTWSVAVGDLNGDGFLDIIQGNKGQSFVYLNDGQGNVARGIPFGNEQNTRSVAVGDVNNDGFLDIVQGNVATKLYGGLEEPEMSYVYLNGRQGGFASNIPFGAGQNTQSIAVGDLDADGSLDIIQGISNGQSYIYLNDGQGNVATGIHFDDEQDIRTWSVAVGDLNGDGLLDIIQGNFGQKSYVYLNEGQAGFSSGTPFGVERNTASVAVGDVNNDGFLDIVQGNEGNIGKKSYAYLNNGQEGFANGTPFNDGTPFGDEQNTRSVAVGDINNDGFLDIIQGNSGQSFVYLNDGRDTFVSTVRFGAGLDTQSVAVGDLNGDGSLDIIQGISNGQSYIYLNNGQGNFASGRPFGSGQEAESVAVGDLNGDGSLDIIQGNFGQSYIYLNDGQGNFASGRPFGSEQETWSVAVGDLNGDGLLDIIQGNSGQSFVYLNGLRSAVGLPNNGPQISVTRPVITGNANFFSSPVLLASAGIPIPYTLFDPEGDVVGRIDASYSLDGGGQWLPAVATSGAITTNLSTAVVAKHPSVLSLPNGGAIRSTLNLSGTGQISNLQVSLIISHPQSSQLSAALESPWPSPTGTHILLFDRIGGDSDGFEHLTLRDDATYSITKALGPIVPIVTAHNTWSSGDADSTHSVAWGDVDGDNDLDLAVANAGGANKLYLNESGLLQAESAWRSDDADNSQSIAWGDVDGDGDLDLAVANAGGANKLYLNEGGVLQAESTWRSGDADDTLSVAWGDVDSDGDLDLAVANVGGANKLYVNEGGVLQAESVWRSDDADNSQSIAWGDVDGDSDLDLAVANAGGANKLYLNEGGLLQAESAWRSDDADNSQGIAWGDVDGDGDLDLAVANAGGANKLYLNEGGVLQTGNPWHSGDADSTTSIAWADVDGDDDLDLAAGNVGSANKVYLNESGVLQTGNPWNSGDADSTTSIAWGDVDGDGDFDLAIGNDGSDNRVYLSENGVLRTDNPWSDGQGHPTSSVAWGDVDGDGNLDLAVGNAAGTNKVYRNVGGVLQTDSPWSSGKDESYSVAWGDVDGDGDLDLAVGNTCDCFPLRPGQKVYLNEDGILQTDSPWTGAADETHSVAWGDVDGDGDLDLAVGNWGSPNKLYLNEGGVLQTDGSWTSSDNDDTNSVAWGDVDSDGDLDLAVGNSDSPNKLYLNEDGVLQINGLRISSDADRTNSVAWGDVDGDGDLDLAVGNSGSLNSGSPNKIYINERGSLRADSPWTSADADSTSSVAWGDVDGDGDLDLAVGNRGANKLYLNEVGNLQTEAAWVSDVGPTDSVAWGDVDGDGDLDLAVGNWGSSNKVYLNEGGGLQTGDGSPPSVPKRLAIFGDYRPLEPLASLAGTPLTTPLTLVITDSVVGGTGQLDSWTVTSGHDHIFNWDTFESGFFGQSDNVVIRMVAYSQPLSTTAPITDTYHYTNSVAGPYQWPYASATTFPFRVRGTQVRVVDEAENPLADAQVYRLKKDRVDGAEPMADASGRVFRTDVHGYLQGRGQIEKGDQLVALWPTKIVTETAVPAHMPWHFYASNDTLPITGTQPITGTERTPVVSTIQIPDHKRIGNVVVGLAMTQTQRAYITASLTSPAGEVVNLITATHAIPDSHLSLVFDDAAPTVFGADVLTDTMRPAEPLAAFHNAMASGAWTLRLEQDSNSLPLVLQNWGIGLQSSDLYNMSAAPDINGLTMYTVKEAGVQPLTVTTTTVSSVNRLMLFDLDVSLEWDARNDGTFLDDLGNAIKNASAVLFDVTEGQVALGDVNVYQAKQNWLSADVVIYASNGLRPRASMGGVVAIPISDTKQISPTEVITFAYGPGQIRMGPFWDPFGQNEAELRQDWWLAFAHELSHYLFFLPDNYLGIKDDVLQKIDCPGSFMTDTYESTYREFLTSEQWNKDTKYTKCKEKSVAAHTTGRADWETLFQFLPMLRSPDPPAQVNPGPHRLPLNVTRVHFPGTDEESERSAVLPARNFDLRDAAGGELAQLRQAQGYLFKTQGIEGPEDDYVIALGSTSTGSDRIKVRGAEVGDRVCIFDSNHRDSNHKPAPRMGCQEITANTTSVNLAKVPSYWQPDIVVSPVSSRTLTITVTQRVTGEVTSDSLHVQVLPATGSPTQTLNITSTPAITSPVKVMVPAEDNSGTFTTVITLPYPAFEGFVRVWVSPTSMITPLEAITQYFLSTDFGPNSRGFGPNSRGFGPNSRGFGPNSRGFGPSIRGWGANSRSLEAPIASGDGTVTIYNTGNILFDPGVGSLQALASLPDMPIWMSAVGQAYRLTRTDDAERDMSLTVAFNYLERDAPPGFEHTLTIYYRQDKQQEWQRLPTKLDTRENLASTQMPQNAEKGEGIYALIATVPMPALRQGWNHFAYTIPHTRTVEIALESIADKYTRVYHYDPTVEEPWRLFTAMISSTEEISDTLVNRLSEMEFGQTYLIHATENITPYLAVPDVDMTGGLAVIDAVTSKPKLPPATYFGEIMPSGDFSLSEGMKVRARVDGFICGESAIKLLSNGVWFYLIHVEAEAENNRCGVTDQEVVFRVDERVAGSARWDNTRVHYQLLDFE